MTETHAKLIHEGDYVAEVDVALSEMPEAWEPYMSVEDAVKLDTVRKALKTGDVKAAAKLAKVYRLVRAGEDKGRRSATRTRSPSPAPPRRAPPCGRNPPTRCRPHPRHQPPHQTSGCEPPKPRAD